MEWLVNVADIIATRANLIWRRRRSTFPQSIHLSQGQGTSFVLAVKPSDHHQPLPSNRFSLHLPSGTYTLQLQHYGRQTQTLVKSMPFALTETGQHPLFDCPVNGATCTMALNRFTKP